MSVFTSIFNGRKGIHKRLNNFTHPTRAQSPPSPASFVSPDVNDKAFNPYSLYEASQSSISQQLQQQPSGQGEPSKRASSPKVKIDFPTDGLSLSDWFPAELLHARGESPAPAPAPRPERNASLAARGAAGASNLTVNRDDGLHSRAASSSGHSHMDPASNASAPSISGLHPNMNQPGGGRDRLHSFSEDDVIVIEAPRGRDVSALFLHLRIPLG